MARHKIAWLPGDGIGKDVMDAARIVLDQVRLDAEYMHGDIGWEFWCTEGDAFPQRTIDLLKSVEEHSRISGSACPVDGAFGQDSTASLPLEAVSHVQPLHLAGLLGERAERIELYRNVYLRRVNGQSATASDVADLLSLAHALANTHKNCTQVSIEGRVAISMINLDHVAIAVIAPSCHSYDTTIRSINRSAFPRGNIDTQMS